jgi:hypothetical protein
VRPDIDTAKDRCAAHNSAHTTHIQRHHKGCIQRGRTVLPLKTKGCDDASNSMVHGCDGLQLATAALNAAVQSPGADEHAELI